MGVETEARQGEQNERAEWCSANQEEKAAAGALVDMESSIASRPGKERYTPAVDGVLGGEKAMQCNAICKKRRGSKKTARC